MINPRKKILAAVAAGEKNLELLKDVVLIKPTEHIVRGLFLERTSIPNRFYAWSLIVPLFGLLENLSLNYSTRISWDQGRKQQIIIEGDNVEEAAHALARIFAEKYIPELQTIVTAADFAKRFSRGGESDYLNIRFEMALAHCISDEFEEGRSILDSILQSAHKPSNRASYDSHIAKLAQMMISKIDGGRDEFHAAVEEIEAANVKKHFRGITLVEKAP